MGLTTGMSLETVFGFCNDPFRWNESTVADFLANWFLSDNTGMIARSYDLHRVRVVELLATGAPLRSDREAVDVISVAAEHQPDVIVIPSQRFDDDFFRLKTGIAGQVIQKFLTYGLRLVIVGDISEQLQESSVLRDFVYECNSRSNIWFIAHLDELSGRLRQANFT